MMSTKDYSSQQEKKVSEFLNGKTVVASGSRPFHPGDVEYKKYLIECKTHTESDTNIIFYPRVWIKIASEAMSLFKCPVYVVDDGSQEIENMWCVFQTNNVQHYIQTSYPYKVKKNLIFDNRELRIRHSQDSEYSKEDFPDLEVIYKVPDKFGVGLGLCPLTSFKQIS